MLINYLHIYCRYIIYPHEWYLIAYAYSELDYPNVLCHINMSLDTCVKKKYNTTQTTHTKNIFSSCDRTRGVYTDI